MAEFKFLVCVTIRDTRTGIDVCVIDTLGSYRNQIVAERAAMKRACDHIKDRLALPRLSKKYNIPVQNLRAMVEDGVIDFEALGYGCEISFTKKL